MYIHIIRYTKSILKRSKVKKKVKIFDIREDFKTKFLKMIYVLRIFSQIYMNNTGNLDYSDVINTSSGQHFKN